MASITIRNLEEETKRRLKIRAAKHGRSMEEEARLILNSATTAQPGAAERLGSAIRSRVVKFGGIELELPAREPLRQPPDISG